MSLFPGNSRPVTDGHVLDDLALQQSMALAMEEELQALYPQIKGMQLPVQGREDRRLLFVAIARGILKYFKDHEEAVVTSEAGRHGHTHSVILDVTMNGHNTH